MHAQLRILRPPPEIVGLDERSDRVAAPRRLTIGPRCRWLARDGGAPVDLGGRGLLRRLLAHLVLRRLDSPGTACAAPELISAGWPEERIIHHAARNRLYVALCYLRKKGLEPTLRTDAEGWYLDPTVEIVLR